MKPVHEKINDLKETIELENQMINKINSDVAKLNDQCEVSVKMIDNKKFSDTVCVCYMFFAII